MMRPHARRPPAKKRFGQHFLEPVWVNKLVRAIGPRADEDFIEIGAGHGALTWPLAERTRRVTAFEIDEDLAPGLRARAPGNVTVVAGDFLEQVFSDLDLQEFGQVRVAANLPYNVAAPILFRLLDLATRGLRIGDATVMLQREVADRLIAPPGSREYGVLSVLVQHQADVERLLALPPGAFRPSPKVQSAVVRLRFHPPQPPVSDRRVFRGIVQSVFTRRRKTMSNAIRAYGEKATLPAWLDGSRRPETLSVAEFARLADDFAT